MPRFLKVLLIILAVILIIVLIIGVIATRGMKDIKNYRVSDISPGDIRDGVYQGECTIGRWQTTVSVTVKNHMITGIETLKSMDDPERILTDLIIRKIIDEQTLNIDTVSGASISTKAYVIAVYNALEKGR